MSKIKFEDWIRTLKNKAEADFEYPQCPDIRDVQQLVLELQNENCEGWTGCCEEHCHSGKCLFSDGNKATRVYYAAWLYQHLRTFLYHNYKEQRDGGL